MNRICRILSVWGSGGVQPPQRCTQATFTLACTCCTQLKSKKVTNFWQALSFGTYQPNGGRRGGTVNFSFSAFGFCIFHGFSILIEIYAHIRMRRMWRDAEVDPLSKRVAHSPLWSRVRQKLLQIVENFEIYMPKGKWKGLGAVPDMIYKPHSRYLCVAPRTKITSRKVHAKHFPARYVLL